MNDLFISKKIERFKNDQPTEKGLPSLFPYVTIIQLNYIINHFPPYDKQTFKQYLYLDNES